MIVRCGRGGKELGHGGVSLVNRAHGHLGGARHRASVMEFRVGQHKEAKHGDQLVSEEAPWLLLRS